MEARAAAGATTVYGTEAVAIGGFDGERPFVTWRQNGQEMRLECSFIAGCDGFHGVCRASLPRTAYREYEKVYPFGWLGLLADTPPVSDELLYASSERGFALCSMRSRLRSRYYLQVPLSERITDWSDAAILGRNCDADWTMRDGSFWSPVLHWRKALRPCAAMWWSPCASGRLFLAGDAGHIVPPTGAKGLNLAATDVKYLSSALIEYFQEGAEAGIDHYSERCLRRVWRAARFSCVVHQPAAPISR